MFRYIAICLVLAGCKRAADAAPDAGPARSPDLPAQITLNAARTDVIYSWQDEAGAFHDTQKPADVPAAYRKHVLVRDLARQPEELHADEFLYVADLGAQDPDGGIPYAVVSRYRFHLPQVVVEEDGGFSETVVTVYGTSWCGACAQARVWLESHHVTFVDKDIEKDEAAAKELALKAKRAGVDFRGVPVIDVKGHLLEGFDPHAVEQLLNGG